MKIKLDYVTNSSSTSFILITDKEINKNYLLQLIGIEKDSEFRFIFEELFEIMEESIMPINEYMEKNDFYEEQLTYEFSENITEKIDENLKMGRNVYMGNFPYYDKIDSIVGQFFYRYKFEYEDDVIYFGSLSDG